MKRTAKAAAKSGQSSMSSKALNQSRDLEEKNKNELKKLKRLSPEDRIFPPVAPSPTHTVAVSLPVGYKPGDPLVPEPLTFVSKWEREYVPMPCSAQNETNWKTIKAALGGPMRTVDDIANAIKSYHPNVGNLSVLKHTVNNILSTDERQKFFATVLPGMVKLCLELPEVVTCPNPFLFRLKNHSITLSQKQVACLLANAFFCTFPKRFAFEKDFPSVNFTTLLTESDSRRERFFASRAQKLRCYLHYFERVIDDMPKGLVTYTRKVLSKTETPDWSKSEEHLKNLIVLQEGTIENEGERLLQVDFADEFIGGLIYTFGAVQEEILFLEYPELLISRLFTQKLEDSEAFLFTGPERFCIPKGYSATFIYNGNFVDTTPSDSYGRKCTQILAIDATRYGRFRAKTQYERPKITREVNKAYIGFLNPLDKSGSVAVASGRWGCGVFRGDPQLKTIIQLLAASKVGRDLIIFCFGNGKLQSELAEIHAVLKDKTVGQVWGLLEEYQRNFLSKTKILEFLRQQSDSPSQRNIPGLNYK